MTKQVSVKIFNPVEARIEISPNHSDAALTAHFVASCVDFPEDYIGSVTMLKTEATKLKARSLIKEKIEDYFEQSIIPWEEYEETIEV